MFRKLSPLPRQTLVACARFYNDNFRNFTTKKVTVDEDQVKHFSEMAKIWWDPEGKMKMLHSFNSCRVLWITNRLAQIGLTKTNANESTLLEGLSLLDVGCGGGFLTEALARLGGEVTGVDATKDIICVAEDHASSQNLPNLRYEYGTIQEHALENTEKYDVVISSETIEHVTEKEEFVKFCVQCLKPGGSILITTPSKTWLSNFFTIYLAEDVLGVVPKGTHNYDMFVHIDCLTSMLKNENCEISSTTGIMNNPLTIKWFLTKNKLLFYAIHGIKKS